MNLFNWLAEQSLFPKVYYCDKESGIERAAVGARRTFSNPPHEAVCCYGGLSFPSQKNEKAWEAFGACRFWQPVQEIVQQAKTAKNLDDPPLDNRCTITQADESISLASFYQKIDWIKERIQTGQVEKVVLARKRSLRLSQEPSVWQLMPRLQARKRNATLFAFQMDEKTAFFGATPETFFRRKGRSLVIDALAGSSTATLGEKEEKEFAYVKQFIQNRALPFATHFHWHKKDQLLATSHLHHLYNTAHLQVREDFSDAALIQALHPTPAVGGVERDEAIALIEALEPFQRGWYASPVGYLSQDQTHLCVGLRSGLLCADQLHLYAGAGIIAQSVAKNEWDEIDLKMRLLLESI